MGIHGLNSRLYSGGVNLSTFLHSISSPFTIDTAEVSVLTDTAKKYISGIEDADLSGEGYFSGVIGDIDPVLFTALRAKSPVVMNYLPSGDIGGGFGYGLSCLYTNYEIDSPIAGAVGVSLEAKSIVGLERTLIIHPLTLRTISGTGTAYDHGEATTAGGVGYLQVATQLGVNPTLAVKIQHSTNNIDYVDLITFTVVEGITVPTAERVITTGTVNRWVRAIWTLAGASPTFTFFISFGRY